MTLREYILKESNCKSFNDLKTKLLKAKKYEYGCYFSEIKYKGFSVKYTSNPNCFASFIVSIPFVGMVSSYGLDSTSITPAGKQRGCASHYLTNAMLNKQLNLK